MDRHTAGGHAGDTKNMSIFDEELRRRIRDGARAHFSAARGSHDWDHSQRVYRLCRRIGEAEVSEFKSCLRASTASRRWQESQM